MYVHIISNTSIATNPPRSAVIDGAQVVGQLPEPYLNSQGWYRLDATTPAPETPDGYHAEPRYAYDSEETPTRVVQSWEIVQDLPPPPRTFSKFRLKMAIASAGLLEQFEQLLSSVEVLPGYSAAAAFADAVTLDEGNEKFKAATMLAKERFGRSDEQIESILSSAVAS